PLFTLSLHDALPISVQLIEGLTRWGGAPGILNDPSPTATRLPATLQCPVRGGHHSDGGGRSLRSADGAADPASVRSAFCQRRLGDRKSTRLNSSHVA